MKRVSVISILIICLIAVIIMTLPVSAASSYIRGDADGDGDVAIMDVTVIQRKLVDLEVPYFDERAADVDGDELSITDATWIQRYLAEFQNIYHINETVTIPDPTVPQPTRDPYELPIVYH